MTGSRAVRSALIVAAVVLVAAGGFAAWRMARPASSGQRAQALYHCPMHPAFTSDRPGTCPICNMSLVKVGEKEQAAGAKSVCYQHNCPMVHDGQPCPMLVLATPGESVECPACGMHVADAAGVPRKVLYWTDPMLPGYRSDSPGKSPMGMDLVPVYEEVSGAAAAATPSPAGYAPILLTPAKQQLIGVETAVASRRLVAKTIRTVGTIAHDPELYQTQAEYIHAVRALEQARRGGVAEAIEQAQRLADAARVRLKHMGLSDELIQEVAARQEPEHTLLFAHPGEPVWVYAQLYEYDLPLVQVGQALAAEAPALPGHIFHGVIRSIDPMIDPVTRTTRIRAQLEDSQGVLKPDMYVNVAIVSDLGEVLAIPTEAVFQTGTRAIVFVDKGRGLFEPRDVTLGAKADELYEVREGIAEGERVVTSGNFLIDSESRLKAALEGMASGEHQHGQ